MYLGYPGRVGLPSVVFRGGWEGQFSAFCWCGGWDTDSSVPVQDEWLRSWSHGGRPLLNNKMNNLNAFMLISFDKIIPFKQ